MSAVPEAASERLRAEIERLSWPDRFDRLAAEDRASATQVHRAELVALTAEYADRALSQLREEWGSLPLKEAILRLPSKRMRGALGQAAKRLRDRAIVELTERGGLPTDERFGRGLDERVVEIPLALATARLHASGEVLDAGFALNIPVVRQITGRPIARMTHFTLMGSSEPILPGDEDRFVRAFGDLRAIPFPDDAFDRVVCVSTLEHVGMNNARFGVSSEPSHGSAADAVSELIRVMAAGGELLITVPYGRAATHDWFQVFDRDGLDRLLEPASVHDVQTRFFYYDDGWGEGTMNRPSQAVETGFSPDVVTGVAIARVIKTGAHH
jgi:SAM-dependent methyltransferase